MQIAMVSPRAHWSKGLQYGAMAVAGVSCALPGALLPAMLTAWHLQDRRAGMLFLFLAVGSALGALALTKELRHSIVLGFALLAAAAVTWAYAPGFLIAAGCFWGLGIGMVMTAITLMRRQRSSGSPVELVRLNLLWAAGACVCPVLLTHALRASSPGGILLVFAAVFAALAFATLIVAPIPAEPVSSAQPLGRAVRQRLSLHGIPVALLLATLLSTGVEASGGAWLATYAERSRHGLGVMVAAPTCLWAGLLTSRALGSLNAMESTLRRGFHGLLFLVAGAALGLLSPSGTALLLSAFLLGFGLGPLYPSLLARVMGLQNRPNGVIFFLCGITSAVMPWLVGVLSTRFASLRAGFTVIAAGGLTLLVAGLRLPKPNDSDTAPTSRGSVMQVG